MAWVKRGLKLWGILPVLIAIREAPQRVSEITSRIDEMERRLAQFGYGKKVCPFCGGGPVEITHQEDETDGGGMQQVTRRTCPECGGQQPPERTILVEDPPVYYND